MNFGQYSGPGPIASYELEIPLAAFFERLGPAYEQCRAELKADKEMVPDQFCPLHEVGYPPLEKLVGFPFVFFHVSKDYLWNEILEAFLPFCEAEARFMINSVETVLASSVVVVVAGHGYHVAPGFAARK